MSKTSTTMERQSDRELVVTRTFDGPARLVFEAWTKPELVTRWWAPRSSGMSLLSCELEARAGGAYRFAFGVGDSERMVFFGKYLEATPPTRLVWTNEESGDEGAVTTATFEEREGSTLVTVREVYPSKEALDATVAGGEMEAGTREQHEQLDELLLTMVGAAGAS